MMRNFYQLLITLVYYKACENETQYNILTFAVSFKTPFSVLSLLVGQQEGYLVGKSQGIGLLVITV